MTVMPECPDYVYEAAKRWWDAKVAFHKCLDTPMRSRAEAEDRLTEALRHKDEMELGLLMAVNRWMEESNHHA